MLDSLGNYDILADNQSTDFKIVNSVLDYYILDISFDSTTQKLEITESYTIDEPVLDPTIEPELLKAYNMIPVEYNGIEYNIVYKGQVIISEITPTTNSIIINLDEVHDDSIPKSMLDSLGNYDILADNQSTDFKIVNSVLDYYILDISFDSTTQKLEIAKHANIEGTDQTLNTINEISIIIKSWFEI